MTIDGEPFTFTQAALRNTFATAARLPDATILLPGQGPVQRMALRTLAPDEL